MKKPITYSLETVMLAVEIACKLTAAGWGPVFVKRQIRQIIASAKVEKKNAE